MAWLREGTRPRRVNRRVAAVAVAMLAAAAPAACTGDEDPTIPTVGGTPTASITTGEDPLAQELAFVACMREEGIADMPDPVPGDTSGRSAVRYAIDVLGKGSDPIFQAALEKCLTLLPAPPQREPASPDEVEAQRQFARCMRENGRPEFPDPEGDDWGVIFVQGDNSEPLPAVTDIDGYVVVNLGDPVTEAAFEACQEFLPSNDDG